MSPAWSHIQSLEELVKKLGFSTIWLLYIHVHMCQFCVRTEKSLFSLQNHAKGVTLYIYTSKNYGKAWTQTMIVYLNSIQVYVYKCGEKQTQEDRMSYINKKVNPEFKRFWVKFSIRMLPLNLLLYIFAPVSASYFKAFFVPDHPSMKTPLKSPVFFCSTYL